MPAFDEASPEGETPLGVAAATSPVEGLPVTEAAGNRQIPDDLRPELEQRYRPGVERSLQREILLAAVARQENLTVSEEEIAAEIDRMAQADPRQAAKVRARYQTAERREGLGESLLERKAMDVLIEAAQVKEEMDRFMREVAPHFEGKHKLRRAA